MYQINELLQCRERSIKADTLRRELADFAVSDSVKSQVEFEILSRAINTLFDIYHDNDDKYRALKKQISEQLKQQQ